MPAKALCITARVLAACVSSRTVRIKDRKLPVDLEDRPLHRRNQIHRITSRPHLYDQFLIRLLEVVHLDHGLGLL